MNDQTNSHMTIKRLLGPAEEEILCDECFEKIDEYVDLELLGAEADEAIPGMRAHLDGCPACHEEYESLRELARTSDGWA
jgi:anti-sigma factor RsiW